MAEDPRGDERNPELESPAPRKSVKRTSITR